MRLFMLLCLVWGQVQAEMAPEAEWLRLRGTESVRLQDYRGKLVWLDFWASWCGPCRKSLPAYQRIWQRYRDRGLVVLAVSLDEDRQAARQMADGLNLGFELLWDQGQRTPALFGVRAMPTAYLIGPQGALLWSHAGYHPGDDEEIIRQIEAHLP